MIGRGVRAASAVAALGAAIATPLRAAGFGIFEQGTRARGQGMAFTGQADDPSALFYNVGGLAFLDRRDFAVGLTVVTSSEAEFRGADPSPGSDARGEQETLLETPAHAYWVEPVNRDWNFGVGLESPFGLSTEWSDPAEFAGRYLSTRAALRALDLNPSVGYKLTPELGVGVGLVARFSDVELERFLPANVPGTSIVLDAGRVELESDFEPGLGWNAGLLHRPSERFSWGLSYRSRVRVDYDGEARFTQIPTGIPPLDAAIAAVIPFGPEVPVSTEIEFPDMASLGVSFAAGPALRVQLDANWTGWSSFDAVPLTFPGRPLLDSEIEQEWDDAMNYRAGLAWTRAAGDQWRFGLVLDETPQPDEHVSPLLADADRLGLTLGWGRDFRSYSLDLAVMILDFDERTTRTNADGFNGTYESTAWLFGATVGF